jgi:hypothetical protein
MNRAKINITAALALAIAFTITACEEKKGTQETAVATVNAPVPTATESENESVACKNVKKPDYNSLKLMEKWSIGVANGGWETAPTRIVIPNSECSNEYVQAVSGGNLLNIKYIGEKKTKGEPNEMDFYFDTYDNSVGSEYEVTKVISFIPETSSGTDYFLYNYKLIEPNKIILSKSYPLYPERPTANNAEITVMEKLQSGRKIIDSEVFAEFSIDGKQNRLMLMRYKNTDDGLFKIVLHDHDDNYLYADYPCELYDGEASWRADLPDEPGGWSILFVGRVAEGLFIVTRWSAPEGNNIMAFIAKNGKLEGLEE